MKRQRRLGEILIDEGKITHQQLDYSLSLQKSTGKRLGEILLTQGLVSESDIVSQLQKQLHVPFIDLSKINIDPKLATLIPFVIANKYKLVPFELNKNLLKVAMDDPLDFVALADVKGASKCEIAAHVSFEDSIVAAIRTLYKSDFADKAVKEFSDNEVQDITSTAFEGNKVDDVRNAPIVRLIDSLIDQAIQLRASDIHIEPFEEEVRVRIRTDGVLQSTLNIPKRLHPALVARLKIMGGMNIAEKRMPQDGRIEINASTTQVDLRLSVMPTWYGEKVVCRLLDRKNFLIDKEKLGFTQENLDKFDDLLKSPHGLILVTGPTGSGKTTTLYTMLSELNKDTHNVITIEDPVEYMIKGINQTQVNTKAGLTFALGLRAILRQDPDIVMVGEIRDKETAEIAVRAAITGHLVLSTLHTNDAISAIVRLIDMDVDSYLLAASLVGIISQRLLRKICSSCKTPYYPTESEMKILGILDTENPVFQKGAGCSLCNHSGYKGRIPVHEILVLDKKHKSLIGSKASIEDIRVYSKRVGMNTLLDECIKHLYAENTTVDEAIRVSYTRD